jgi:hypothetical protein
MSACADCGHADDGSHQHDRLDVLVEFGHPGPAHLAIEIALHGEGCDQVGQRIGAEFLDVGLIDLQREEDVEQRREHEGKPRQREQPEQVDTGIADALPHRQTLGQEWTVKKDQDLQHALAPARALADESNEGLRLQAGDQRLVDIERMPALGMQAKRGFAILGDRLAGETANGLKRLAAQHRCRTAEEGCIPLVEAALQHRVEHLVLRRHRAEGPEILFQRIGIEEIMRCLHQEQLRIFLEEAHGFLEEFANRRMVGVKHHDQIGLRHLEAVIEIAGLGVIVLLAGMIFDSHRLAQRLELLVTPGCGKSDRRDPCACVWPRCRHRQAARPSACHADRSSIWQRPACGQKLRILIVGRDEHIHGWKFFERADLRRNALDADRPA